MRAILAPGQAAMTSSIGTQAFRVGSHEDPQAGGAQLGRRVQEAGVEQGLQGSLQGEREGRVRHGK